MRYLTCLLATVTLQAAPPALPVVAPSIREHAMLASFPFAEVVADRGNGVLAIATTLDSLRARHSGRLLVLMDKASHRPLVRKPMDAPVTALAFSPDGRSLAVGAETGELEIWTADLSLRLHRLRAHSSAIEALTFAGDGAIVSVDARGVAMRSELVSKPTSRILADRSTSTHPIDLQALAAGGDWIAEVAVVSQERYPATELRVRRLGRPHLVRRLALDDLRPETIAISTSGRWIAVDQHDGATLWDTRSGETRQLSVGQRAGTAAFSPDERTLALTTIDDDGLGRVVFVDTASGEPRSVAARPPDTERMTFSRDGRRLLLNDGHALREIDVATGEETWCEAAFVMGSTFVFSPDGRVLVATGPGQRERAWSTDTWSPTRRHLEFDTTYRRALENLDRSALGIRPSACSALLAASRDGRWLACAGHLAGDGRWESVQPAIFIVSAADGTRLATALGHTNDVRRLAFSPDGRWLVSGADDGTLRVWALAPGPSQ